MQKLVVNVTIDLTNKERKFYNMKLTFKNLNNKEVNFNCKDELLSKEIQDLVNNFKLKVHSLSRGKQYTLVNKDYTIILYIVNYKDTGLNYDLEFKGGVF